MTGRCEENCCANTDRLLVTDRANRANLLKPAIVSDTEHLQYCNEKFNGFQPLPFMASSSSMGCFRAVMSRNVKRKRTTTSFSFLIGAT